MALAASVCYRESGGHPCLLLIELCQNEQVREPLSCRWYLLSLELKIIRSFLIVIVRWWNESKYDMQICSPDATCIGCVKQARREWALWPFPTLEAANGARL